MTASPDRAPLAGRSFPLAGQAPALDHARLLLESLGATVDAEPAATASAAADWAGSGAMALTGPAQGPPALAPGAPASALAGALAVFELLTRARTGATALDLPGTGLLGERAALAGFARRAPRSVGGAFRALRAADGWLGLSLARPDDVALLPALTGGDGILLARDDPPHAAEAEDVWRALSAWLARRELGPVVAQAHLLGLSAAPVPAGRRPGWSPGVLRPAARGPPVGGAGLRRAGRPRGLAPAARPGRRGPRGIPAPGPAPARPRRGGVRGGRCRLGQPDRVRAGRPGRSAGR